MKKLISMTDFVIAMREDKDKDNIRSFWSCEKYARFLKQPLELWMFVPCDLEGNALEEKKPFQDKYYEYQQAKERCLFDGFEIFEMDEEDGFTVVSNGNFKLVFDLEENSEIEISNSYFNDFICKLEDLTINKFFENRTDNYNLKLTQNALKQIGL